MLDGNPGLPKEAQPPTFLLLPNCWMDQDATWYEGRPRSRPHCVRWDPVPSKKGDTVPQFPAHVCCGQMAGWINVPLGRELGLCPSDIVLDGDPAHPSPKRRQIPPIFGPCMLWPNGWMDQDGTWYGGRPRPRRHCVRCGPSSPALKKGVTAANFWPICIVANGRPSQLLLSFSHTCTAAGNVLSFVVNH